MKVYLHCYEFHEPLFSIFYKTKVHEILYYYNLIRIIPGGSLEGFSFVPEMKAELEKLDVILDSNFERGRKPGLKGRRFAIIPRALVQLQPQCQRVAQSYQSVVPK